MALPAATIASWDEAQLIRFLEDYLRKSPPSSFTTLVADQVAVAKTLLVEDKLTFSKDIDFHTVGSTGEPAFANSWVNYSASDTAAAFWKDPLGFVHLRGTIKSGTINTVAFTLPPGSRPSAPEYFATVSNGAFGACYVAANGDVKPAVGSNLWFSLSGITFKAKDTA